MEALHGPQAPRKRGRPRKTPQAVNTLNAGVEGDILEGEDSPSITDATHDLLEKVYGVILEVRTAIQRLEPLMARTEGAAEELRAAQARWDEQNAIWKAERDRRLALVESGEWTRELYTKELSALDSLKPKGPRP
jgi:hypothetical protein